MRPDAAGENGVAVVQQVVRRDGGCGEAVCRLNIVRRFTRGDVFKNNFQFREITPQGNQLGVDEYGLPVKQVNVG